MVEKAAVHDPVEDADRDSESCREHHVQVLVNYLRPAGSWRQMYDEAGKGN